MLRVFFSQRTYRRKMRPFLSSCLLAFIQKIPAYLKISCMHTAYAYVTNRIIAFLTRNTYVRTYLHIYVYTYIHIYLVYMYNTHT